MNALEALLDDTQPGYETPMEFIVRRLMAAFGVAAFEGVSKAEFPVRIADLLEGDALDLSERPQLISDVLAMAWWCGLEISDEGYARLARCARAVFHAQVRDAIGPQRARPDPAALTAHAVFVGRLVNRMHSPTRGAFDYVRALAADPLNRVIDVFHTGVLTPDLAAYASERLGGGLDRVRFIQADADEQFLARAVGEGPRTFHMWCEEALNINISLVALFGPTLMFTCGDVPPVQFADVYWYGHEADYIQDLWRRRGAPERFVANYLASRAVPFNLAPRLRPRSRAELGFGPDDVVIATVGNRLGVEMDQAFVDGVGSAVLANPGARWVVVGALQDFWIDAFGQVLGDQFRHIPFEEDLAGLLGVADIFANPFRSGGGNSAIIAVDAGAAVLTRGDMGDVAAFVPAHHRAADAEDYLQQLQALIADPALRAARLVEQQAMIARQLDQDAFALELKALCAEAYDRFAARAPASLDDIFAADGGATVSMLRARA